MWLQYWSSARYTLHLTDAEFYALTPRECEALLKRQQEEVQHSELLAGIIASAICNHSLNPPKQPCKPSDFMPSQFSNQPKEPVKRQTRKTIANNVHSIFDTIRSAGKQ